MSSLSEGWRRGQHGWPARFPVLQLPNAPLIVALAGWRFDLRADWRVAGGRMGRTAQCNDRRQGGQCRGDPPDPARARTPSPACARGQG